MSINQKGFSIIEGLLILVIVGILGGAGWYVYSSNKKAEESLANADKSSSVETKDTHKEIKSEAKKDYSSFSVKATGKLTDQGKCKSGEVLFARIYNTSPGESYEYECQGPLEATQYVSVVLGQRTSSVLGIFSKVSQKGESVILSNGVKATKYSFDGERKGHGTSDMLPTKFTIYEANDGKDFFYALYWTGKGFQDEDYYLGDFNEMALKSWEIK